MQSTFIKIEPNSKGFQKAVQRAKFARIRSRVLAPGLFAVDATDTLDEYRVQLLRPRGFWIGSCQCLGFKRHFVPCVHIAAAFELIELDQPLNPNAEAISESYLERERPAGTGCTEQEAQAA